MFRFLGKALGVIASFMIVCFVVVPLFIIFFPFSVPVAIGGLATGALVGRSRKRQDVLFVERPAYTVSIDFGKNDRRSR